MNEQDKSMALAELMGWKITYNGSIAMFKNMKVVTICGLEAPLNPYKETQTGRAQFAALLLKFPEVIPRMCTIDDIDHTVKLKRNWNGSLTQENILNEILKMNEVAG